MPMFYMMVGLPGSGKSFTAESIPNAVVHSSDAIRAEVLGDENDQTQQDLVFQTLHKRVLQDLVDGKDVVYDATNINYKRRIGFLDRVRALHKHDLRTVCFFMATPYEVCLERNNNRERSVPESVIQKMYFKFDVPMMAEGWDEIRIVGDEDRHDQIDTLMLRLSKLEHDNPHHEYTVGQHSMTAWQYLISHYKGADAALLRATLLHDIGKEKTKVFHDIKGNPTEIAHFYHHERVGAYDSFCYTGDLSPNQRLKAVELGQTAIAFTEHGNIYQWVAKKMACDKAGLKYLHGCEVYLTEKLLLTDPRTGEQNKVRDNYHTILIAKNYAGLQEMNELISRSNQGDHFYYKPRITFDEFLGISSNVIKISACLASPLNRMSITHPMYERLLKHYDYLEIQAHDHPEQVAYNRHLAEMSQKYGIPLIAGTDTHSLNKYKAECRTILQLSKHIEFADEDTFDLTYKSYDELVAMFATQDALPEAMYLEAIENTNRMADSVEPFELDISFKYPILYGERDREVLHQVLDDNLQAKIKEGAITPEQIEPFKAAIAEECRVFDKIEMSGFMLFMSELVTWCKSHGIPIGFNRGSCGGSRVAYVTNTTDLNPETWHTVFSRFCNEDRKEIGDIDIDVSPSQRDLVYDYIINRFGQEKTAFILAIGTIKSKGCIDEICRALALRWNREHQRDEKEFRRVMAQLKDENVKIVFGDARDGFSLYFFDEAGNLLLPSRMKDIPRAELIKQFSKEYTKLKEENERIFAKNPWAGKASANIKKEFEADEAAAREKYPEVFYYYDGLLDVAISQSMHPAGIVASPITLTMPTARRM